MNTEITLELVEREGHLPYFDLTWKRGGDMRWQFFRPADYAGGLHEAREAAKAMAKRLTNGESFETRTRLEF